MRLWVIAMPIDWLALCATVFALGLRHGLDADHLVAIDGMTRFSHEARRPLAPWCGALFFDGSRGRSSFSWQPLPGFAIRIDTLPAWATVCGEWASIGVLLALGIINLVQVMRAPPGHPLAPVGIQGRLLSRLTRTANPFGVAIVGASFRAFFRHAESGVAVCHDGRSISGMAERVDPGGAVYCRHVAVGWAQRSVDGQTPEQGR